MYGNAACLICTLFIVIFMGIALLRVKRIAAESDHAVDTDSMIRLTVTYGLFTLSNVILIIITFAWPNAKKVQTGLDCTYLVVMMCSQLMLMVILNDLAVKIASTSEVVDSSGTLG